jgi:putative component of toxin-antitoxin plasmid stabilization module
VPEPDLSSWDFADAGGTTSPVLREMTKAKMSVTAAGRVEEAMGRISSGASLPGETGSVRPGVYELRVDVDKRWYRLLYGKHKTRWVALFFAVKKRNDLDKAWIVTAGKRLKGHKKLHP